MDNYKYILYARKSTKGKDRQVQSINNQLQHMRKLAKQMNLNIVYEIEERMSAKKPYLRHEFNNMLAKLNRGEANAILTFHVDRLSRNAAENGLIGQMLDDKKIAVIQTNSNRYDARDNALLLDLEASMARKFSNDLSVKVSWGMSGKIRDGGIPGPAPQGYINNTATKLIEIDDYRFPIIRSVFDKYINGMSVPQIKLWLDEIGYTTPKRNMWGGKPISRSSLYEILSNTRYAGHISNPFNPDEPGVGGYEHMITADEYDQVQRLLGRRGGPRLSKRKSFLYRGILRCGECGCSITSADKKKKLSNGKIAVYSYYFCTRKRPCNQKAVIQKQDLIAQINKLIEQYTISDQMYEWGLNAIEEVAKIEIATRKVEYKIRFDKISELDKKKQKYIEMFSRGLIDEDEFNSCMGPIRDEIRRRQSHDQGAGERSKEWYEVVGEGLRKLHGLQNSPADISINESNQMLLSISENWTLNNKVLDCKPYPWIKSIQNGQILSQ